jgi:hypothetical protein
MSTAIQHTVAFSLRHTPGSTEERDFLSAALDLATIPGVQDYRQLRQISPKSTFTHSFAMIFADQQAYQDYNNHPIHMAFVGDRWQTEVTAFQELDFVDLDTDQPSSTNPAATNR